MENLNNNRKMSVNAEKELRISDVISSLTLEDITKIVNAFTDINIPIEAVKEEIELNYL
jgi:cell fate regulator YaaT (PSP1 superfamily)